MSLKQAASPYACVSRLPRARGKSFLIETLFLWAVLNGHNVKAAAPTGIAAARLRMPRTPVSATTLHYLFKLSIDGESKVDTSNPADESFQQLAAMTLGIIDEASMVGRPAWSWVRDQVSSVGAAASRTATDKHPPEDSSGRVHLLLAMDLKQLPRQCRNLLS